jgi:hypothetical protein
MTVRLAHSDDLPAIVELGDAAIVGDDKSLIAFGSMDKILAHYMLMPGVWFYVDENNGSIDAAMVGMIATYPWNPDATLAYVVLWWSRGEGLGGAVFREFRKWATDNGADYIMAASRNDRTSQIYERYNMQSLETNYIGVL